MSREEVYVKLNEVFREFFGDDELTVVDETTAADVDGWDSLEHINLIVAVENTFDIEFNMGQVNKLKNVGEMVDLILTKVK